MRVLVTWGSRLGGTARIARLIREVLVSEGFEVVMAPVSAVRDVRGFHAAVIGGALYTNHWHRDVRRFVAHNDSELRRIPVWLFSSSTLDESIAEELPPTGQVLALMRRIAARGHATFGHRAQPDSSRNLASRVSLASAGPDLERVCGWASELARVLRCARPSPECEAARRALARLVGYGVLGWAACAAVLLASLQVGSLASGALLRAAVAPLVFALVAARYFRLSSAREPLYAALAFTAMVGGLDALVLGGVVLKSFALFTSFSGTWLPLALVLLVTWVTGSVMTTSMNRTPPAPSSV